MRSAAEWSTSAMIAVEPVSRNATVLATPITKSTKSATATARVLVVIRALYYLSLDMWVGRPEGLPVVLLLYPGTWKLRRRMR